MMSPSQYTFAFSDFTTIGSLEPLLATLSLLFDKHQIVTFNLHNAIHCGASVWSIIDYSCYNLVVQCGEQAIWQFEEGIIYFFTSQVNAQLKIRLFIKNTTNHFSSNIQSLTFIFNATDCLWL